VKYTYDGTYLVSGSDDTNLRLWKSKASEQLGVVSFLMALKLVLCLAVFVACCCSGPLPISGGSLSFGKFRPIFLLLGYGYLYVCTSYHWCFMISLIVYGKKYHQLCRVPRGEFINVSFDESCM